MGFAEIISFFGIVATVLTTISLFILSGLKSDFKQTQDRIDSLSKETSSAMTTLAEKTSESLRSSYEKTNDRINDSDKTNSAFRERVISYYPQKNDVDVKLSALEQKTDMQINSTLSAIDLRLNKLEVHAATTEEGIKGLTTLLPQMVEAMKTLNSKGN